MGPGLLHRGNVSIAVCVLGIRLLFLRVLLYPQVPFFLKFRDAVEKLSHYSMLERLAMSAELVYARGKKNSTPEATMDLVWDFVIRKVVACHLLGVHPLVPIRLH